MDQHEFKAGSSSAIIDIQNDDWNDSEDIELDVEEHDLFLRDNYVKSDVADLLPYKATSPVNDTNGKDVFRSQNHVVRNELIDSSRSPFETLQLEDSLTPRSPSHSSVVYQTPNYEKFAGSLAPSSPASVVASFIIVVVILLVTILPMMLPQSTRKNGTTDHVILDNLTSQADTSHLEHTDARCKCICPPQALNNDKLPIPTQRRLYVGNTSPNQCNCNNIVQPHLADIKILLKDFCARCECRYQSRDTSTIRRNIIFFIAVLTGLSVYMIVQCLLKYFRITRRNLPRRFRWLSHQLIENV